MRRLSDIGLWNSGQTFWGQKSHGAFGTDGRLYVHVQFLTKESKDSDMGCGPEIRLSVVLGSLLGGMSQCWLFLLLRPLPFLTMKNWPLDAKVVQSVSLQSV